MAEQAHEAARRLLGEALRRERAATGMTQGMFAAVLSGSSGRAWHQTRVSKLESGAQLPTAQDVDDWATEAGADAAALHELLERALSSHDTWQGAHRKAGGARAWHRDLGELEARSRRVGKYQPALIPGLVQTPDYMRALLTGQAGPEGWQDYGDPDAVEGVIAGRVLRQSVLRDAGKVQIVMLEAALTTLLVPAPVMAGQLGRLAELATGLPGLELGVVPRGVVVPAPTLSGWGLYDSHTVNVETATMDEWISDPAQVAPYVRWFEQLRRVAVHGEELAAIARGIAAGLA